MLRHRLVCGMAAALLVCAPACTSTEPVPSAEAGAPPSEPSPSATGNDTPRPPASPPPAACFGRGRGDCHPVSGAGCLESERCDFSETDAELTLACAPADARALEVGARCSSGGPPCARGSRCAEGVCRAFCCGASDCMANGETCLSFDDRMGTLGVCGVKPACVKAGGACRRPTDCCSNDCHAGHCH